MKRKKFLALLIGIILILPGCGNNSENTAENAAEKTTEDAASQSADSAHATVSTVTLTEGKYSEEKLDDTWDESTAVAIRLEGNTISADSDQVDVEGNTATIKAAGTYLLSGTLEDGQILVEAGKDDNVKLVLNQVSLTSSTTAPIFVKSGKTVVTLAEGTENAVTDASEYVYETEDDDEPYAAIFAKDDLTFNGTGTLTVEGNYKDGIVCKDDLKFVNGTYHITAADDGIVGKDSVSVKDGSFTIEAGGDGIKSTNIEETDKGYIILENGDFEITAGNDGVQAETLLRVNDGQYTIVTGGGSAEAVMTSGAREPMQGQKGDGQMRGGGRGEKMQGEKPDGTMPDGTAPQEGAVSEGTVPPEGEVPSGTMQPEGDMPSESMPEEGDMPNGMMQPEGEVPSGTVQPEREPSGNNEKMSEMSVDTAQETESGKALKSYVELQIAGGEFTIDSIDDGLHSNQDVTVEGGTLCIKSGDDGIHAEQKLSILGGNVDIQQSYEGLEGHEIAIEGGDVKVTASDDGVNAAGEAADSNAASGGAGSNAEAGADNTVNQENGGTKTEFSTDAAGQGKMQMRGGMMGDDQGASLTISGGTLLVNAEGDGLDANGNIYISGGTIILHGPSNSGNGTLDYASECKITGGTLIGAGSSGMAQGPSEDSTQPSLVLNIRQSVEAGTVISVKNSSGEVLDEMTTEKTVQWFIYSSPELKEGETYSIYVGNEVTEVKVSSVINQS
ncbi:MAG: carbohydrate-binding domain-containing protein [Bariatricus sp.]